MYNIPASVKGRPIGTNSVNVNPGKFTSRSKPLTTMLVVVSKVAIPPRIVPNANGINNFDEDTFERRAIPEIDGKSKDAAAILFMNNDNIPAAAITPKINRRSPAPNTLMMARPIRSVKPDRRSPSARINAAIMMMTAERLNPEKASCGVRIPLNPNASISINATMSARKIFPRSNNTATPRNNSVRSSCDIYKKFAFPFWI